MPELASVLLLAPAAGSLVGFSLGLVGGGGSILAVPLLIYVVGVDSAHVAIGTGALAVAANAGLNLLGHARAGTVKWRCAAMFGAFGAVGAWLGSSLGKAVDGDILLVLFSLVMLAVAAAMLRRRPGRGDPNVHLDRASAPRLAPRLIGLGVATGFVSGFFGIGGGFLIVPGLILAAGMPILCAVGSSLVVITGFGLVTAANYAVSGLVDWQLAGLFLAGGAAGGLAGVAAARRLAGVKRGLELAFAGIVAIVGLYMLGRGLGAVA